MNASRTPQVYKGVNGLQFIVTITILTVSDAAASWVSQRATHTWINRLTSIYHGTNVKNIARIYGLGGTVGARLRSHRLQQVKGDAWRCRALRLYEKLTSIPPVTTR